MTSMQSATYQKAPTMGEVLHYTGEITTIVEENGKTTMNKVAELFSLTYLTGDGKHSVYRRVVNNRYLLNERNFVIQNLNKVQSLALKVAAINDDLIIHVDEHNKMLKIQNTDEIRAHWAKIKTEILLDMPDMKEMTEDFEWQLEEDNIQNVFLQDNFLNHLFRNILGYGMENGKEMTFHRTISNGIGDIDIPIVETVKEKRSRQIISHGTILVSNAQMDEKHEKFPLEKLKVFVGTLDTELEQSYAFDLDYNAEYHCDIDRKIITESVLEYSFTIGDVFKKTNLYNLKLESDE